MTIWKISSASLVTKQQGTKRHWPFKQKVGNFRWYIILDDSIHNAIFSYWVFSCTYTKHPYSTKNKTLFPNKWFNKRASNILPHKIRHMLRDLLKNTAAEHPE